MVGDHWFVYPVHNGVELVIDSADPDVSDRALAQFVSHFTDYNLAAEWSTGGGEIMHFVPAPVDADVPAPPVNTQPTTSSTNVGNSG
ncbi:MAG TPA: hypothetical protein VE081_13425 [Sporichthyaceae bacterium]|nr:hypothetical protein [Sporichthyaceae bacterium]